MKRPGKPTKPGKAAPAAKGKKATPSAAPPRVKVPKRTTSPTNAGIDPHSELHPGDPDAAAVAAAERGREAAEANELVGQLSEEVAKQYGTLTAREMAFVRAYLELRHATPAAIKAGYSKSYASAHAGRLLNKPAIRAIVQEIDQANLAALRVTDLWIKQRLVEEAQFAFEGGTRVKALVALAEIHEMFPAKRVKHSADDPLLEALRQHLDGIDGAGTGLPPPTGTGDGQRA